jgi:hypothetical protein
MADYFSEKFFLSRLKENAINMSEKQKGILYNNYVILFENRQMFPELNQSFVSVKDLFHVNNIFSVSVLSKKAATDFMYSDEREDVGCIAIALYGWIKKNACNNKEKFERLMAALPDDYKNRFMEVKDEVAEDIKAIGSSIKAVSRGSVVASSIVSQEPADYFVNAIKNVGLEIREPETIVA